MNRKKQLKQSGWGEPFQDGFLFALKIIKDIEIAIRAASSNILRMNDFDKNGSREPSEFLFWPEWPRLPISIGMYETENFRRSRSLTHKEMIKL